MMRKIGLVAVVVAGFLPAIAWADESDAASEETPTHHEFPLGTRTRAHLERQRNGDEASVAHGLTPPAERRARKRYLQSFEHPIPELFEMDEGGEK